MMCRRDAPRMMAARRMHGKRGATGRLPNILLLAAAVVSFAKAVRGVDVLWDHKVATQEHQDFLGHFHDVLANNQAPMQIVGHDVMAPQRAREHKRDTPPERWIKPTLFGEGDDSTTVWFCDDNLYFLAFTNKTGHLHTMRGYDAMFVEPFNPLPFSETYTELTDAPRDANGRLTVKPHNLLVNVPPGKASLLDAVRVLSSYNPATVPVSEAKLAVLKILLMIPESLRFHPVRNAYILRWHVEESRLTEAVTNYVPKWPLISKLLMEWDRYDGHQPYHWSVSRAAGELLADTNINSAEEALGVVDLVIRII